jgi:hypothetical protein
MTVSETRLKENYIAKRLGTSQPLAEMGSFAGMHSDMDSQGTPLNERFRTSFEGTSKRTFIGMDASMPREI